MIILDERQITIEELNSAKQNLASGYKIVEIASGKYKTLQVLNG